MPKGIYPHKKTPIKNRFWSKVDRSGGCWNWMASLDGNGYGQIIGASSRPVRAHRVAWELTNGLIPTGLHCLHRCDNARCVRPSHLFLGTHKDNMTDKEIKGRGNQPRGELNGRHKLKDFHYQEIEELLRRGISQREIAKTYDIHHSRIYIISKNKRFKPADAHGVNSVKE